MDETQIPSTTNSENTNHRKDNSFDEASHKSSEVSFPQPQQTMRGWPWGQVGWSLVGVAFSLIGVGDVGLILGFIGPSIIEVQKVVTTLLVLAGILCSLPAVVVRRWAKQHGTQVLHLSWLRKVNYGLFAASVSLVMLSLTIPAIHAARVAQQQTVARGPWHIHSFGNSRMQISTPANWEVLPNPNVSANGIYLADRPNDLYLTAVLVPKQDLAVKSLSELSQNSAMALAEKLTEPWSEKSVHAEVNGLSIADAVQGGTLNGMNMVWFTRHMETHDAWIEVRMWTTRSRFEDHSDVFSKIANSVRHQQ